MAAGIVQNLADHIVGESRLLGVAEKSTVFHPQQASPARPHPQRSVLVGAERPDRVGHRNVVRLECDELAIVVAVKNPATEPNPDIAGTVLGDRPDILPRGAAESLEGL